jgi:PAS domain S-box-containing protein
MDFFRHWFSPGDFHPHGFCYMWNPTLVWLHAVSDGLIGVAYFTIPITLRSLARRRADLPFPWMFFLFGTFIVACGSTHLLEVWNLWHADYWVAGAVKAITAVASLGTAILLVPLVPQIAHLPSLQEWIKANADLHHEIRERRDLEVNLRLSEATYREQAELIDLTHDAIFVCGLDRRIIYWNRAAERLYGWSKDEARGAMTHDLLKTQFPTSCDDIQAELFHIGSWEGELIHTRRDGRQIIISSRWALRTDSEGQPVSILESNRDITLRKKEEEKFRNLFESAPDAFVIANGGGRIHLVNKQTEKLFGYSRQELIGQPVEVLLPERFHTRHLADRSRYAASPHPRPMGAGLELLGRRKDGSEFPVEVSLSPLQTGEGNLISSAIRDVTQRQVHEREIRKLNAELNQKITDLNALNRELESFSYSVSHDLRAPLRHMDGFARILKEEHAAELSEEAHRYLDRILQAANHMGQLVDDLIKLARIGRKEMVRKTVKLDDLVRQELENLPKDKDYRDVEWRIEPLPEMDCDAGLVKLVFSNLLSNAFKFTRNCQPAVVEVGTLHTGGVTTLFVRDNGVGFDPQYADKLFGVFQRLHRQEDFEGTGVGLATVQRIIHRHGGEVWAESRPGEGATFFFTLAPRPAQPAMAGVLEAEHERI